MTGKTRVLVLGAGAVGSFYGAILKRGGAEVSVISRSDYETVVEHGLNIASPLGDLSFRPDAVYRDSAAFAASGAEAPDFLVVTLKLVEGVDRVALMRPLVGPETTLVLIENGIDIEPEIARAFPDNVLISGLAFVAVSRMAPGRMEHKAYGWLVLGDYPQGAGQQSHAFAEMLEAGGVKGDVRDDVIRERWKKCVWNTAFNPASVLAGGADTSVLLETPGGEELIRSVMGEVLQVAEAEGYLLNPAIPDKLLETTRNMPAYHNSMALDFINGRAMEVEPILGNVVRLGDRHGLAIPRLRTVYSLLQLRLANALVPDQAG